MHVCVGGGTWSVHVFTDVCVYRNQRSSLSVFISWPTPYFLRGGRSLHYFCLTNLDRLANLHCLCLHSIAITSVLCHAWHFMCCWSLNSSSHAFKWGKHFPIRAVFRAHSTFTSKTTGLCIIMYWCYCMLRLLARNHWLRISPRPVLGIDINMNWDLFASVFSDLIPLQILQEMYIMTFPKIEYLLLYV